MSFRSIQSCKAFSLLRNCSWGRPSSTPLRARPLAFQCETPPLRRRASKFAARLVVHQGCLLAIQMANMAKFDLFKYSRIDIVSMFELQH